MDLKSFRDKLNKRIAELESNLALQKGNLSDQSQELNLLKEKKELIKQFLAIKKQIRETKEIKDLELKELRKQELDKLRQKKKELKQKLNQLIFIEPSDSREAILEIQAGTGGDEAELFANDLLRMYLRYAEKKGFKVQLLDWRKTPLGGIKQARLLIKGQGAYGVFKFEGGVHRVQRIPKTEKKGRIHTSAVGVAVLPKAEEVDIRINENELKIDTFRSSGPGGQSVNTTDSAVRITHLPSGISVSCQDEKSQHKNKEKALKILRSRLLALKLDKRKQKQAVTKKTMVKTLDRSDKIRTYNFSQSRITDHRVNLTIHNLEEVLDGNLDELIEKLKNAEIQKRTKELLEF